MFQVGRSSIPKPAPRNLEDLDSVQRVLLHRSVLGRGARERPPSGRGDYGKGRGNFSAGVQREESRDSPRCGVGRGRALGPAPHPFQNWMLRIHSVLPLGVWPPYRVIHPPPGNTTF